MRVSCVDILCTLFCDDCVDVAVLLLICDVLCCCVLMCVALICCVVRCCDYCVYDIVVLLCLVVLWRDADL